MTMITVQRLSQLRILKREVAIERERLAKLRALSAYGQRPAPGETGGKGGGVSDRTGFYATEIAYLEKLVAKNMHRCVCELLGLQTFINEIESSELRQIFTERYIKGRSWLTIAFLLGWSDEQMPRKRHDKYLKKVNAGTNCTDSPC